MALDFSKFGTPVEQSSALDFSKFGTPVEPAKSKERTFGEAAKDIAAGVVSGAGSLVQLPGQLYGLATGDFSETGALGLGKDIAKFGEEMKSAGLKAREAERAEKIRTAEQKGQWEAFKTAFGETIKDPALLTSFLAEQAPQLLVPFGAAKVAQIGTAAKAAAAAQGLTGTAAKEAVEAVTKEAARRGTAAAVGAGAVQQGADVGAQSYEDIYKELVSKGATEKDAAQGAINLARAAGASGALISLLAQRLPGAKTLEESFAGVRGPGGRLIGAARGALGEGASEIVEETGGKFGANLALREVAPETELTSGLGATAGMAAIGGVGMGGAAGLAQRPSPKIEIINGKKFIDGKPVEEEKPVEPTAKALEYKPEPFIQFPDGTVAKRSEVEAYIKTLPEDQQMAMRAKLLGLAPQEAEKEPAPPAKALEYKPEPLIVYPDGSVAKRSEVDAYIQGLPEDEQIPARAKLLGMGEEATQVTPEMLRKLGIRGRAPIIQRLTGLELTDPKVTEELTNFAQQPFASPEVRGNIFGFLNTIKPIEAPAAPEVPAAPPVAPAPVSEAPPAVEPPAPPVTPTVETPAPAAETPATPVEAAAPVVETAAPAEKPTFEPKIVSRQPAPDGMEVHVFTTTDGYGTGLFDADAGQYVDGSITRFAGSDTLPKAENKAAELLRKATPTPSKAEAPAVEAPAPELTPAEIAQQIKDLKDQQTKLLTKAGKVPAPRSPARQKYDALSAQIADLESKQLTVRSQKPRKRPSTIMGSPMLAGIFNQLGGLHTSLLSEVSTRFITKRIGRKGKPIVQMRNPLVPGYGTLFNKDGKFDFGEIAEYLEQEGYLEPGSLERDYKDAGERAKDLIKQALNREEVLPIQDRIDRDAQEREASERQRTLDRQEENRMIASGELQLEPEFEWTNEDIEKNLGLDREFETDLEMYDLEPKDLEFLSDEELESELTDAEREQAQARRTRKAEEDAARQKAEGAAPGEDEEILTRPTAEGLKAKQEAAEKAAAEEKKAKAAEQERLRKEQQAKEEKARADETVKDFELGKSAEEQMTGMGDLFAVPPAAEKPPVGGFRRATAREANSDNAQFVYDVGNGARLLFVPSQNGDVYVAAPGKGASLVVRTGDNRDNVIKTVDQFPDYIPENIRQIVLDYHKAVQGKTTDEEQTAVAMEMAEKIEALTSTKKEAPPKREPRQGTPKQLETADGHAKSTGGTVVYQDGDIALVRGFSLLNGQPVYVVTNGDYRSRVDIEGYTGNLVTPEQKSNLVKIKQDLEAEDKAKFDKSPSIKFTDGLATSANVSPELAGIVRGWKELLGLKPNLYVTTIDDAVADRNKFTGPHRAVGSAGLDANEAGQVRRLPNGDYYIAFKKGTSKTKMLEVLAHELGHMHEREVFNNADADTKKKIREEHDKWLMSQKGRSARELIQSLRAKTSGKTTRVEKGLSADQMTPYWKSFAEWYADQVSRWAVTSEKPVSVVEKFFSRLAQALKSFYSKLKNAGYLPNETFVQYLEKTHAPSDHVISTDDGSAQQMLGEAKAAMPTGTPGQQALETIRAMGMDVPKPDPTKLEKAKDIWQKAKEDPKLTAQSAIKAARDFMDKVETWAFSPDAKLNNDFRRAVIKDFKENESVLGQLLEMSQSQAVHADALSSQFLIDGGLKYNDDLKKWESFQSKANFPALSKKLDEIGAKYGLTKEQIERVAHTYLVAKRLPGLIERNKNLDAEIAAEQASIKPDKTKIKNMEDKKVFISDKQLEQIEPGLSLVKNIPELNQVVDMWNEIRKNTIDVMVNSGLWSPEYAQAMWDNMDYVPYFREDQIENEAGPQEFIRGLQVKSKEFQLKGSEDAVHDVFDNMIRWTQYAINRSVRAHKALQMVDNVKDIQIGDRKMAVKVTEEKRGMNIARVFRDGKQELYDMADPMYVQAFSAIQNVSIPTLKFMARVSNVLRQSVVLYPLFSVAQVPQDAFAAMFTSGLKTQHALKIPILAVKEFIKTLNKTSQTHETLKRFGATGVRDFSATVIRDDAEIYAGLKPPRGGWGKTKEFLSHISMAADNAVRQAVYEASMQQGVKQSEAIEKAFEVINFRRKGTSKMLNILGQTVPFFYAYLSAQRVALKVLTGTGISPTDRKEAFQTLATTSAAVATLSMLYAMANGDDEDYMETPAAIRDRTLTIPGSGGVRIPLRPDFFLFPKIVAEHTYLLLSEQGYQDAAKFRTSMKDALISAVASPTPFPTAIKPAIEVAINYDFFQGKPLIGTFEKDKALERQFRDSTSEFAKLLGSTGLVSPIAADHMIRGMFGSFGGLFLYGTNQFLHSDPDVPRPELNATEMLAALPGTSGLLKRPQESALKNDFYTLRDEVEKAVNTFNDIKLRSPQGMEDFLADEKNMVRLSLGKSVDKINRELSKIRKTITVITNMPESQMSAEDKADYKRQLMEMERELLRSVDVKALREMAKI